MRILIHLKQIKDPHRWRLNADGYSEAMDMSFVNQTLAAEPLVRNRGKLEREASRSISLLRIRSVEQLTVLLMQV
jgi:hypothetical protein